MRSRLFLIRSLQSTGLWATSMLLACMALVLPAHAQDKTELTVKITESLPAVDVKHGGQTVRIQRIQSPANKLTDDNAKTSRPCPPFCLTPMYTAPGVETYGELEVLDFMSKRLADGSGLVIDNRLPEFYQLETIPGSVNIPFSVLKSDNPAIGKILNALGVTGDANRWDFSNAKHLLLWCSGVWCDQSSRAIKNLAALGYPANKLKYYRGGLQAWKLVGLTTVAPRKD